MPVWTVLGADRDGMSNALEEIKYSAAVAKVQTHTLAPTQTCTHRDACIRVFTINARLLERPRKGGRKQGQNAPQPNLGQAHQGLHGGECAQFGSTPHAVSPLRKSSKCFGRKRVSTRMMAANRRRFFRLQVDTKKFYLPQTRQRKYLFAFDQENPGRPPPPSLRPQTT